MFYHEIVAAYGCLCTKIDLLVAFRVGDSNSRTVSIKQRNHNKSLISSMLHHIYNLRYSRHLRNTNCVAFEPLILDINLDVVSSSNVFCTLVFVFRCNVLLF